MKKFLLLIFQIFFDFCICCFPTPLENKCPTITTGPMFDDDECTVPCPPSPCAAVSGTRIAVTETPDSSCQYTASATCTVNVLSVDVNPQNMAKMRFNGIATDYSFPQTLRCDTSTGQYTYTDTTSTQQPVTSVECVCAGLTCGLCGSPAPMNAIFSTTSGPDDGCIWYLEATCGDPGRTMLGFGPPPLYMLPEPQTVTCPAGYTGFFYNRGGIQTEMLCASCP